MAGRVEPQSRISVNKSETGSKCGQNGVKDGVKLGKNGEHVSKMGCLKELTQFPFELEFHLLLIFWTH